MAVQEVATQEGINPQLIPMIDIMFLLLLIFMLGADMGQREPEDVRLPLSTEAIVDRHPRERGRPLTVNCAHADPAGAACAAYAAGGVCREGAHWRTVVIGRDLDAAGLRSVLDAAAAPTRGYDPERPHPSEQALHLRADAMADFGLVQRVLGVCEEVGIHQVEVGVAAPGG
jgi:biopolymer transport protein ExbD